MNITMQVLANSGVPIPLSILNAASVLLNGQKPDSDDGKVVEITGDDVAPEIPPTPVTPEMQPTPEKIPSHPTKPEGTGTDQRHQA